MVSMNDVVHKGRFLCCTFPAASMLLSVTDEYPIEHQYLKSILHCLYSLHIVHATSMLSQSAYVYASEAS